jgi:hypothetical protein
MKLTDEGGPIPAFPAKAFMVLRGGPGQASLKVVITDSEDRELGFGEAGLNLQGADTSHNMVMDMPIPLNKEGSFNLRVEVNGETIARMPYHVRVKQTEAEEVGGEISSSRKEE